MKRLTPIVAALIIGVAGFLYVFAQSDKNPTNPEDSVEKPAANSAPKSAATQQPRPTAAGLPAPKTAAKPTPAAAKPAAPVAQPTPSIAGEAVPVAKLEAARARVTGALQRWKTGAEPAFATCLNQGKPAAGPTRAITLTLTLSAPAAKADKADKAPARLSVTDARARVATTHKNPTAAATWRRCVRVLRDRPVVLDPSPSDGPVAPGTFDVTVAVPEAVAPQAVPAGAVKREVTP